MHKVAGFLFKNNNCFFLAYRHGGSGAAHYAEKNMVAHIEKQVKWNEYLTTGASDCKLLGEALIDAFESIDLEMREFQRTTNGADTSGCTSVTAMITPQFIICANAGDSRCILGTRGIAKAMSEDHKPTDEIEKRRIEAAGGTVQWKRVDGDLAVSRALGDFQYKNNESIPHREQKVTYLPDITVHERTPDDEVLLLACDGLWDVMSNDEAAEHLRSIFRTGESEVHLIAEEMVDIALAKGKQSFVPSQSP